MNKKLKTISDQKIKSTSDRFMESLTSKERKKFDEGFKDFVLSELVLAIMERDEVSVRKLAELADISPTVVQAMKSGSKKDFSMQSFFKVLNGLGCKRLMVELNGEFIPMDISHGIRK